TALSTTVFAAKRAVFQVRRGLVDLVAAPPRLEPAVVDFPETVAEARSPLVSPDYSGRPEHQAGKIANLRVACAALDGLRLPPGAVFSFWRHVGRPTRARGYVEGRMLQGGSLSPAVGGGLCQLSTALYEVALQANLTILERHAHSRIVPGPNAARAGRDATVAWNYVDLRFASPDRALRLGAVVTADDLVVSFRATLPPPSEG
ncbi:MAG: VanW family protein, partial [Caulobacter sp.]